MPSNNQQLLRDYHDASKRLGKRHAEDITDPEHLQVYRENCAAARELVTRCVLAGKPRSLGFLILELATITKIIGADVTAHVLQDACRHLIDYYEEQGI